MQYRKDQSGTDISILGYGCMRFTKKNNAIDIDKAEKEIMTAIKAGVNYFDTAYVYGGSEAALGEILERNHCRDQVFVASKLPHYLIKSRDSMEKRFREQLARLKTDHIDYYLMHMLTDIDTWERLKIMGVEDWIREKIDAGQIRHIGFSYHGGPDMFIRLVDAYPWEFCQIQYNYMDENSQAGRRGLKYAAGKGIPVVIMEPLRGGKLVDLLPEAAKAEIARSARGYSPAEWAFRWLWNQPEVTTILSGMNSVEMVEENVRIADTVTADSFTEEDFALIERVKSEINRKIRVNCTGCGYCLPCPQGVDIPGAFRCLNEMYTEGKRTGRFEYMQTTAFRAVPSSASLCVACGKCELHCPQSIGIRKELKNAARELETVSYKIVRRANRILKLW